MLEHLPERDRPAVKRRLRAAWAEPDQIRALDQLRLLASELDRTHSGAASSLREGTEETLTLTRFQISGQLKELGRSWPTRQPAQIQPILWRRLASALKEQLRP